MIDLLISHYLSWTEVFLFGALVAVSVIFLFINRMKAKRGFKAIVVLLGFALLWCLPLLVDTINNGTSSFRVLPQFYPLTIACSPAYIISAIIGLLGVYIPYSESLAHLLAIGMYLWVFRYVLKNTGNEQTNSFPPASPISPAPTITVPPVVTIAQVPPLQSPPAPIAPVTQ